MVKIGLVSALTSALVPGNAGADRSPLSTFGVILFIPTLKVQVPALCAEAPDAATIAAASATTFNALFKRIFIMSPDSLCPGSPVSTLQCGTGMPAPHAMSYNQPFTTMALDT